MSSVEELDRRLSVLEDSSDEAPHTFHRVQLVTPITPDPEFIPGTPAYEEEYTRLKAERDASMDRMTADCRAQGHYLMVMYVDSLDVWNPDPNRTNNRGTREWAGEYQTRED